MSEIETVEGWNVILIYDFADLCPKRRITSTARGPPLKGKNAFWNRTVPSEYPLLKRLVISASDELENTRSQASITFHSSIIIAHHTENTRKMSSMHGKHPILSDCRGKNNPHQLTVSLGVGGEENRAEVGWDCWVSLVVPLHINCVTGANVTSGNDLVAGENRPQYFIMCSKNKLPGTQEPWTRLCKACAAQRERKSLSWEP